MFKNVEIRVVNVEFFNEKVIRMSQNHERIFAKNVKTIYLKVNKKLEFELDTFEKEGKWYAASLIHKENREKCPFCNQKANKDSICIKMNDKMQTFFKEVIHRKPYRLKAMFDFPEIG